MTVRQPNSKHCFVCGVQNPLGLHLTFHETGPGELSSEVTLPAEYQGYPGIAHGGIIAAMLDEIAGRSHMGSANEPRFMFTLKLEVRYRKNVPTGQPLRLVGSAGERKGKVAEASSAIYNMEGEVLADAKAVLVDVPETALENVDLNALGWRVYSEDELEQLRQ